MTIDDVKRELASATARAQTLLNDGKQAEARDALENIKELRRRLESLEELRTIETAMSAMPKPVDVEARGAGWGEIVKAMREQRAITANGSGMNTIGGIVKALVDGDKLRSLVNVIKAANSSSIVPVFSPHLAIPVGNAPGATGITADSTAVLTGDTLALKAWYSILAVGNDALQSTDIEKELPGIFAEAFAAAIDKAIVAGAGSGSDALGVFTASASGVTTASDIACAAAGTPKWVDFGKLALTLNGLSGDRQSLAIVTHANIIAPLLSESTTGVDPFKVEFLTKGTILGIPVVMSSYAPTTLTAGSYVAVGGYFKHYALAIANEVRVDPIRTVGSDNVTFQAFMYMQGKPSIGSSFRRLKTI